MSHPQDHPALDREQVTIPPGHAWSRLPLYGAIAGGLGLVASFALRGANPAQFHHSWLVAFMFFLSIALGALFFVLIHHLTNASWSTVLRRLAENVMGTLPLFALLFVPIALGLHDLYHWSHADAVSHDALLQAKSGYLNEPFFLARAAGCFVIWTGLAWFFLGRSRQQDSSGDPALSRNMVAVAAPSLFLFAITLTLAAVDWIMSLDPHWYSTIFGVYYFAGCLVGFFAAIALLAAAARRAGLLGELVTPEHFHDIGKLLFAFTVFWAYIAFSQYFLIWYGNVPEETVFFIERNAGSWHSASLLLGIGHFGAPYLYFMSRKVKRRTGLLTIGAVWMLAMHYLDLYWLVMPRLHEHGPSPSLLDLTTLLAVGGLFVAAVGLRMRRYALLPVRDPKLAASLRFENV